MGLFRLFLEVS